MAAVETNFEAKTATVIMKADRALTPEAVTKAFEGSRYALDGEIERLDADQSLSGAPSGKNRR